MTSRNRGGDNSSRASQRGNDGNQEARDLHETGRHDDDATATAGANGGRRRRGDAKAEGRDADRSVGNNTDGVVGSGGDEGLGTRDNG